jgi:predicted RNA binding protein YcfA (HicA-like mRNA interferase family)
VPISRQELIRRLRALGFGEPEIGGKHAAMRGRGVKIAIPNPHGGREIDDALLLRILRQAGVTRQEFDEVK